jgi:hypothetical protein
VPPSLPQADGRSALRWIVVEKRVADLGGGGRAGDGQVNPEAVVLAILPLAREDLDWQVVVRAHDYFVEVIDLDPSGPARPGERIRARVRVGRAGKDDLYRLSAQASSPEIAIFGAREQLVRGPGIVTFQFTSASSGPGGIEIAVEKMDALPGQRP